MAVARQARRMLVLLLGVGLASLAYEAPGQNQGMDIVHKFFVPPSPVLPPSQALKSFKIAPGFRIELVASEPLVQDPVATCFDPHGRIWVCEMRGFMPDINGKGEREPVGTIVVLEDTNGDGVMDKNTIFLDKLILPRSLCWTSDGLLVAENGKIWLCRDTNGDLRCDERQQVGTYVPGNPEHSLNGLMPALDNWYYNAKEGIRLRKFGARWVQEATLPRGQWGITQDDHGRLYYNVNDSLFRGDLVPCYSPNAHASNPLVNVALFDNQIVWPSRPTPGINRGYLSGKLREDGSAVEIASACSPLIFRGDNLPREVSGTVFICDPAVNLIRRNVFFEEQGKKSSRNAYEKADFLTSTDERFRPVYLSNGPDGCLYVADMYRGIVQHGAFMTAYLRKQTLDRGLDRPIGLGRIYRIVHETSQPRQPPALGQRKSAELVAYLSHANGWHRDLAQQLLVQRQDASVVPALEKVASSGSNPLGRLHALWTLEGLNKVDPDLLLTLLEDKDAQVRASAVCLCRNLVRTLPDPTILHELTTLGKGTDKDVRLQVVFTLGLVDSPIADRAVEATLQEAASDPALLEALVAGFAGREAEFLAARLGQPGWARPEPWREKLLGALAGLMWRQRQPLAVLRFLHLVGTRSEDQAWQQVALLEGMRTQPVRGGGFRGNLAARPIALPAIPEALEKLQKSSNPRLVAAAANVAKQLLWPGKDGKPLPVPPPLSARYQALHQLGRTEYQALCAACHHPEGFGDAGKGPALVDSDWLGFSEERLVRLVLHGIRGPLTVQGEVVNRDGAMAMPGMANALDDQKIAAILTYVRREWGDFAPPVAPQTVTRIRSATSSRQDQWTEEELLQIK